VVSTTRGSAPRRALGSYRPRGFDSGAQGCETGTQDRTQPYPAGTSPNSVQCQRTTHPSVTTVLYTDFLPAGKIEHPTATELAKAAIASVAKVAPGQDGITYLRNAIAAGIKTPLTDDFAQDVLRRTGTASLADALAQVLASAVPG